MPSLSLPRDYREQPDLTDEKERTVAIDADRGRRGFHPRTGKQRGPIDCPNDTQTFGRSDFCKAGVGVSNAAGDRTHQNAANTSRIGRSAVISRLEILADLNIVTCDCLDCQWRGIDALGDALEAGHLLVGNHGDEIVSLRISEDGKSAMLPPLPWTVA
jgi:hypothetical protein